MAREPWFAAPRVAALYVETDGAYFGLDDVDPWDESRDARLYAGPCPVVAHPPCKAWSIMSLCRPEIVRGDDGGCFYAALDAVQTYGGVLEHPALTQAWKAFRLPRPAAEGWTRDLLNEGWTCQVDQAHYGHPANKLTWLYYVGPDPPPLIWGRAPSTGRTVRNDGGGGRDQRSRTPPAFRSLLLSLAAGAAKPGCNHWPGQPRCEVCGMGFEPALSGAANSQPGPK